MGRGGNANWIVFASTMAKLDLLLGVCLLLETFYGYSKLTCWIDRAKFGPVWKVFILGVSDQQCLHETLLCLFLLSVLSSSYYKLSMHNDVAQHQGRPQASGESKVAIPMVSIRCRNNPSHEVESHVMHSAFLERSFTPEHVSTTNKRTWEPFCIIWCPCEYVTKGFSLCNKSGIEALLTWIPSSNCFLSYLQ